MTVYSLMGTIPIGYVGENESREIAIDISPLTAMWPHLTPQLIARRPGETDVYPCRTRREGSVLYWTVTAGDTAIAGSGEICVHMIGSGGVIGKSRNVGTRISPSLDAQETSEPPEAARSWVDDILVRLEEIKSGYVLGNQGAENAGKLLYVREDGMVAFLTLGDGLEIRNGVLTITAAVTPQTPILFEDAGGGMVKMSGAQFEKRDDGAVVIGGAEFGDLGGGRVQIM